MTARTDATVNLAVLVTTGPRLITRGIVGASGIVILTIVAIASGIRCNVNGR
jgi:hypothetical protein